MLMVVAAGIVYLIFFGHRASKEKEFAPFESERPVNLRASELQRADAMDVQLQQLDMKTSKTKERQLSDLLSGGAPTSSKHHPDFTYNQA